MHSKQRYCIPRDHRGQTPTLIKHHHPVPSSIRWAWGKERGLMRDSVITPDVWKQTVADTASAATRYTGDRVLTFTG